MRIRRQTSHPTRHRPATAMSIAVGLLGTALLAGSPANADRGGEPNPRGVAEVEVQFDCDGEEWVITSDKGISNIVVSDGEEEAKTEFHGSEVLSTTVDDPDAITIWVKSGANNSDDGPGYGERFDLEAPDCDGDGYNRDVDCDDNDPSINPGAVDIPNNGIDENCDGSDLVVGDGDVRVTLTWDTGDDLDLHVVDPDGDRVWFGNQTVPSGGELDRDDNLGGHCADDPEPGGVENVYWPDDGAPFGEYAVELDNWRDCDGKTTDGGTAGTWHLQVFVDGAVVVDATGSTDDDLGEAFSGQWKLYEDTFIVN